MPDPFALLPLPLPIFILKDLEDLVSLHSIILASPAAYRIFNEHFIEIIESILPNFVPQIQRFLRIIITIRSQPLHIRDQCSSIEAFKNFRTTALFDKDAGTYPLSKSTTTLAAARSLTKTVAKLQGLSNAFFVTHLERVNKIKPHGARNKHHYIGVVVQWKPLPSKGFVPLEIIPCGEPSWIEEQRVLRALFKVVIWLDLQIILAPFESESESKEAEEKGINDVWVYLRRQDPNTLWSSLKTLIVSPELSDEMDCVVGFLREVSANPLWGKMTDDHRSLRLERLPDVEADCFTTPAPIPSCEKTARMWRQWITDLDCASPGRKLFHNEQAYQRTACHRYNKQNSLVVCDFKFLEPLGMAIWDGEKLARLGLNYIDDLPKEVIEKYLLGPPTRPRTEGPTQSELVVRWRSLFIGQTTMQ